MPKMIILLTQGGHLGFQTLNQAITKFSGHGYLCLNKNHETKNCTLQI